MSDSFRPFPTIPPFHSVWRHAKTIKSAQYGAKVKLNGTNSAVRVSPDGTVTPHQRRLDLSLGHENADFRAFIMPHVDAWRDTACRPDSCVVVFGEWAGNGLQNAADAVAQLAERHFFAYGVQVDEQYFAEPDAIRGFLPDLPGVHVIPWLVPPGDEQLVLEFGCDDSVSTIIGVVNELVDKVTAKDPLIEDLFSVQGPGGGVVLTPSKIVTKEDETFADGMDIKQFEKMQFKAHKVAPKGPNAGAAATVSTVRLPHVRDFVSWFVTNQRCLQAVDEVCGGNKSPEMMDEFLKWVLKFVFEEGTDVLQAMSTEWESVATLVKKAAELWWRRKPSSLLGGAS